MNKSALKRLHTAEQAMEQLLASVHGGKPFTWGATEGGYKMAYLQRLGFPLVSLSKLTKGGHELKRGQKPVGKTYYRAPLKRYADLYLLGIQTRRTLKWYDLYDKGKALAEDGTFCKKKLVSSTES